MLRCLYISAGLFLFFYLLLSYQGLAQTPFSDTVYYDKTWKICEKPIATYYRTCTLHKGKDVYFAGAFKDYTLTHQLITEGAYDSLGYKSGLFTYYYLNGETKKQGKFVNNEMSELWRYYRYDGTLYFAGNFLSSYDVTPVYLYNWLTDSVLLINGTGRFVIYTNQYPDVFPKPDYILTGYSYKGTRDGDWNYFSHDSSYSIARENYHYGKLTSSFISDSNAYRILSRNSMEPEETHTTSKFAYDDAFTDYNSMSSTVDRVVRFLDSNIVPLSRVHSTSYNNNLVAFSSIIKSLLLYNFDKPASSPAFDNSELKSFGIYDETVSRSFGWHSPLPPEYVSVHSIKDEKIFKLCKANKQVQLHFRFLVRKDGTIVNLSADGMFPEDLKKKIAYRFSRLEGLVASDNNSYTDLYFYSAPETIKHMPVTGFYISYYNRLVYH